MNAITSENILMTGSILLIAGVLIGKTSYRIGLPLLLIFLLVGMGFGVDGLGIHFNDMHSAQFIGMIALCIILFSGGLSTRISSIRPVIAPGLMLSTIGVVLTALFTGLFIWLLSGMEWTNIHFALLPSLLLAATMSSTDSASVFGILGSQKVGLKHNLRPMLELESGSNDPMAYMITIVLIDAITLSGPLSGWALCKMLLLQFAVGGLAGAAMGKLTQWLIRVYVRMGGKKGAAEDPSQTVSMSGILVIASVFLTFALASELGGNGYLAVYITGIFVGNASLPNRKGITKFVDGLTWLSQIVVFLMLGLLVNPADMLAVAPVSLMIGVFMILVGRPLSVFLTLTPFRKLSLRSKTFVSWVGLRGAVPIIFATYPVVAGVEGASQIFNIVFFVTLLSLIVQGTTVIAAARRLGLVEEEAPQADDFGIQLDDDMPTSLHTLVLTEEHFINGNTLGSMSLPQGSLVIMIKRSDKYMVPNGRLALHPGDTLLLMQESAETVPEKQ
ncbi:MAG: K+/H+ antiporter [Bacteroidales bacterium 52_46]|nr:MAG: K+/H+ antiporter [Bacteroidales bacterium 52_46]